MTARAALAALALWAASARAAEPAARSALLEELRARGVVPAESADYSAEDEALFRRLRRAEAGALAYLRRRPGGAGAPWSVPGPGPGPGRRLTRAGFERYRAALSQEAIAYFELKGAPAKSVFQMKDWGGKRLFDPEGRLTEEGEAVYLAARERREVYWRGAQGEPYGTRRPPGAVYSAPPIEEAPPAVAPAEP